MDGTRLSDPALAERVPMLVSIENNPIARPPSGLNLADLVIEAPVEGNTTRWAAVFMCRDQVDAGVGPIRSVRYFHRDLWQQMHALTLHFGGAGQVLRSFKAVDMPYANGLSGGWGFFYRAGPWGAPHDVFLDVDAARTEMDEGGLLAGRARRAGDVRAPFDFAADPELPDGRTVNAIGFQTASFWNFGWQWDDRNEKWLRTDAGAPNYEALTGDRISTKNVIVQVVRQDVLIGENDPGGFPRRREYLVESGVGLLYVEGRGHDVHWSRETPEDVTTWTYADSGEPVVLPAGKTWWHIVPIGSGISEG